jgi:hypothetical protein
MRILNGCSPETRETMQVTPKETERPLTLRGEDILLKNFYAPRSRQDFALHLIASL